VTRRISVTDFIDGILRAPDRGGEDYELDGIAGRTPTRTYHLENSLSALGQLRDK